MSQGGIVSAAGSNPAIPTLFTENTGTAVPAANNLNILGAGLISTTGSGSTVTIAFTGATPVTWSVITTNQAAANNNGYICNKGSTLVLTLPTTSVVGTLIEATNLFAGAGIQFTYTTGQSIQFGNVVSTTTTGNIICTAKGDTVKMVCVVANTTWQVISSMGNWTVT
jgi:hypothetical protein